MAKEVVVTQTLSEDMIEAGGRLIDHLDRGNFPVHAALWLYYLEAELWRLVIASPGIKSHGPRKTYMRVQAILSQIPEGETRVGIQNISVVDADDLFISILRSAIKTGQGISGIRFSRNTIDGIFVEDAYIYRLI